MRSIYAGRKHLKRTEELTKLEKATMALATGLTLILALIVGALMALAAPIALAVHWIHKFIAPPHQGAGLPRHS